MLNKVLLILTLAIMLLPACSYAEKSGVLVIIDGLGSTYIYPGKSPACIDGSPLPGIRLSTVEDACARYELWVHTPETESGNSVIATGYSGASEDTLSCYSATIYDVLRTEGYLSMAIMETGDNANMIGKPDIILYEQNNSIYNPAAVVAVNGESVPSRVRDFLGSDPPRQLKAGTNRADAYRQYDDWSLNKAVGLIRLMGQNYPGQKYLLVVSVGGTDMAAHESGFNSYRQAIEDLDAGLSSLADACRNSGIVMVVTADHGMSFKSPDSKGSHASGEAAMRNISRLAPLMVFSPVPGTSGTYGQECLAPTLLSLMECPDTLSMQDGKPIPVSDRPSIYLVSDSPAAVSVDGPGFKWQATVNGTCRVGPLDTGRYVISYPSGVRTVELDRDLTLDLAASAPTRAPTQGWLPYAGAAALAAAGIVVALRLNRKG